MTPNRPFSQSNQGGLWRSVRKKGGQGAALNVSEVRGVKCSAFCAPGGKHQTEIREIGLTVAIDISTIRGQPVGKDDAEIAEANHTVAAQVGWTWCFIGQDTEGQGSTPLIVASSVVTMRQTNGPIAASKTLTTQSESEGVFATVRNIPFRREVLQNAVDASSMLNEPTSMHAPLDQ